MHETTLLVSQTARKSKQIFCDVFITGIIAFVISSCINAIQVDLNISKNLKICFEQYFQNSFHLFPQSDIYSAVAITVGTIAILTCGDKICFVYKYERKNNKIIVALVKTIVGSMVRVK